MKALITDKVPCRLEKAELRRVPQNPRSWVVGYHVCCPRCGFVTIALNGKDDLEIEESVDSNVSFSCPLRCIYCQVLIHIQRCVLTLEEDDLVRNIRYR